jgi:predicted dehydrogenase
VHAAQAVAALRAGKAVWLEKPAAIDEASLAALLATARETGGFLTLGFNRRFSSHAAAVRKALEGRQGPLAIQYTIAAGPPPAGTWHLDPSVGGGRVIGEMCHFVDLCVHFVGAAPNHISARPLGRDPQTNDSVVALLGFPDGSSATIQYLANASAELPKERFEISCDGRTIQCDNYRATRVLGGAGHKTVNQDKGQGEAVARVIEAVRKGEPSPLSLDEIGAVTRTTFRIVESAATGRTLELGE